MFAMTGALGEKLVEVELLRNEWMPVNLNTTIKNAPNVDILAIKDNRQIAIQVKTSGIGSKSMLTVGQDTEGGVFNKKHGPQADYVAFVRLLTYTDYEIYIVPVEEAERVAMETYLDWKNTEKRDGTKRTKVTAVIRFELNKKRPHVSDYKNKWAHFKNNWDCLSVNQ